MQVTAKLNNLRMAPRKVRLATNLVKGMDVSAAKTQLRFMPKKSAGLILKLLNSAVANAKHNHSIEENNLYILKLIVDGGPSLKRWMPRAMGRATPILKRTCSISLTLEERLGVAREAEFQGKEPVKTDTVKKRKGIKVEKVEPVFTGAEAGKEETISAVPEGKIEKQKPDFVVKPYGAQEQGKKKFFSRQSFKRMFRRKSI